MKRRKRVVSTRIKTVSVRANVTFGSFQSLHIEASADVHPGQTPIQVLEDLKDFVAAELVKARDGVQREVAKQTRFIDKLHNK